MHFTSSIGYYLSLFIQTQFQLGSYIHAYTNKTDSLVANLQGFILPIIMPAKVGIKSCRFARKRASFVDAWI